MGAGGKKKNQPFQITPATDVLIVDAPDLDPSGLPGWAFSGDPDAPYEAAFMIEGTEYVVSLGMPLDGSDDDAMWTVSAIDPNDGHATPVLDGYYVNQGPGAVPLSDVVADVHDGIATLTGTVHCPKCGEFTSVNVTHMCTEADDDTDDGHTPLSTGESPGSVDAPVEPAADPVDYPPNDEDWYPLPPAAVDPVPEGVTVADLTAAVDSTEIDSLTVEEAADLTGAEALSWQDANPDTPVTAIPEPGAVPVGDGMGHHLLLGGADLYDSSASIINYQDPVNGMRQVLLAEVTPDAEAKLMQALNSDTVMVPTEVTETVTDRYPFDVDGQLWEDISTAAKSVGYHLKEQDDLPEHTIDRINDLQSRLTGLVNDPALTPGEKAAAAAYLDQVNTLAEFRDDWDARKQAYATNGDKLPKLAPQVGEHTTTKTVMVAQSADNGLPAVVEPVSIVYADLGDDGVSRWGGAMQPSAGSGYQYRIDLGDGYTAYYRPHNDPKGYSAPQKGMRGQLEIVAPKDSDNPAALVSKLGRMHLVDAPLTQSEAEYAYLQSSVWSMKLGSKPTVKSALAEGEVLISATTDQLMSARIDEAVGLNGPALESWAKRIRLEAERQSLGARTTLLREAVASASGYGNAATLVASGNYKPQPVMTRVGVKWERFDVDTAQVKTVWNDRKRILSHALQGSQERLLDVLRTGALASQSRRRRLGVVQTGMSEGSDVNTGGSRTVFLRNSHPGGVHHGFEWGNPEVLLARADWYGQSGDKYGAMSGSTRNPLDYVKHTGSGNEIMFFDGIDIYGKHAPTRVKTASPEIRAKALKIVADKGITHVNGTPIDQWIV